MSYDNPFLLLVVLDGLMALPFMLVARRQFRAQGRWSRPVAVWSGVVMHGLALATVGLAVTDAGSGYPPALASWGLGGLLIAFGLAVLVAGRIAYGSQRRVYGLLEDQLIEAGIYRWSRNPQYLGYGAAFLGAAVMSGSTLAYLSFAVYAMVVHAFIVKVEEPHLGRVFGEDFARYRGRVRRYV